jgi:dienelactone hydrolase
LIVTLRLQIIWIDFSSICYMYAYILFLKLGWKTHLKTLFFLMVSTFMSLDITALATSQKINIGTYKSRAIWTPVLPRTENAKVPAVILIPGSGPNGPEEMVPSSLTVDNKDHSIFEAFSVPFNRANIHTLAIGKPGVEFHSSWNPNTYFYDKTLYSGLKWGDLIANVKAAVEFVRSQPNVDINKIYLLGHSEGTQVSIDYAAQDQKLKGIILLGFMDNDISTTLDWQLYRRPIDWFVARDVDTNHDGYVSREEASLCPDFRWTWKEGEKEISYKQIEDGLRNDPKLQALVDATKKSPLYSGGIFARGPIHNLAVSLKQDIYVYNGELDLQTRASEASALENAASAIGKANVSVTIVPGVGHGFSPPRPPRSQPLLDITIGPVEERFQNILFALAQKISK